MKNRQKKKWANLRQIVRINLRIILLTIVIVLAMAVASPANQLHFAIKPQFDVAADFADGLARVGFVKTPAAPSEFPDNYGSKDIDRYGFIDKSG